MKRCEFCGWNSPDSARTCEKCGLPLAANGLVRGMPDKKKVEQPAESPVAKAAEEMAEAMAGETPSGQPVAAVQPAGEDGETTRRPLTAAKTQVWQKGTLMPKRHKGLRQGQGGQAVDVDTEGRFTLMMMPDEDENFVPYAAKHEGHEVILNRSNTEATNKTITGKEQARLVNINNKWFIEDRSEMKTTFVRSSHPIELHSGDLILMGDRVFRFDDLNHPEEE